MNIILFIHSLKNGGAERVTTHLANHWSGIGHTVTILTLAPNCHQHYTTAPEVGRVSLNQAIVSKNVVSAVRNNYHRLRLIRSHIIKLNADVVISMMTQANVLLALSCIGLDIKRIGSERIHPELYDIGPMWTLLRKYSYKFLDAIVTQTKATENWITQNTYSKKATTIPNPVNVPLPRLTPIVALPKKPKKKIILAAGRLTDQKQFDHLITAFSKTQHQDWQLMILGEGEEYNKLQNLAHNLYVSESVTLVGRVGNIGDWYSSADIFALTSSSEGFPNALLEAMAYGTAVISYDCPTGPREIIKHKKNGYLVKSNNTSELTNKLNTLMQSERLRSELAQNARKIKEDLSLDSIQTKWEALIASI